MAKRVVMRVFGSVFFKVIAMMALTVIAVSAMLLYQSSVLATNTARDGLAKLAEQSTAFVAQRASGPVKFSKRDDLDSLLDTVMSDLDGTVSAALILNLENDVLASFGPVLGTAAQDSAAEALATGLATFDRDLVISAEPVFDRDGTTVIGALAIEWDYGAALSEIADARAEKIFKGVLMSLVAFTLCGLALRAMVSKPLAGVQAAMRGVAGGDYTVPIPAVGRSDEIGGIAKALGEFRNELRDAAAATRDAMFRGAGFEGSSASLVLIDPEGRITHANPAFLNMAERYGAVFPGLPPDAGLEGVPLRDLNPAFGAVTALFGDESALPATRDLVLDGQHFEVHANAVRDANGAMFGGVVEWSDVTNARLDRAVLDTLDAHQVKAEFAPDGAFLRGNAAYREMAGADSALTLADALRPENGALSLSLEEPLFGDFAVHRTDGNISWLHGGVCPVRNREGALMRFVVIGDNVTAVRDAVGRAEAEREALMYAQDQMIQALRNALAGLSDGDLTLRIESPFADEHDQLRTDFNSAIAGLDTAIASVTERAGLIKGEVAEISSAAGDLSRRTEHQAATLEQTAAAIAEITASVSNAADGARQANEVVNEARANAEASGGVVQDAVSAMGEIADSSNKISSIISVIDDIAFQTNLLALNAGVEAARAGDAGRGFAVVASEVRALAQRSSDAAREINALISTSGEHVERGVTLVGNAGDALRSIVDSVSGISEHVSSIAVSAQEQSAGLAEVNTAMSQLDQVTQQNAAMFEETTAASQALNSAAAELGAAVARFRVGTAPAAGSQPVASPPALQSAARPQAYLTRPSEAGTEASAAVHDDDAKSARTFSATGTDDGAAEFDESDWEDF
ncbi:MAG: methyl-accepting chemotaxis protein [Pseudomonadota bacterium]